MNADPRRPSVLVIERPVAEVRKLPDPVSVLVVDDEEAGFAVVRGALRPFAAPQFGVEWAGSYRAGLTRLVEGAFDVCLVDYRLGMGFDGISLIRESREAGCHVPCILVTGRGDRSVDLTAMEAGAIDYLSKASLDGPSLERAIRYAITQSQLFVEISRGRDLISGIEEVGQVLAAAGPTTSGIKRMVEMMATRFGFRAVAVYILAGERLLLAASEGFIRPAEVLYAASGSVGRLMVSGRPGLIPAWCDESPDRLGSIHSELSVPLLVDGHAVGILTVGSPDGDPIGGSDNRVILALAERLAARIGLTREAESLAAKTAATDHIRELGDEILSVLDAPNALESLLTKAMAIMRADGLLIARTPLAGDAPLALAAAGSLAVYLDKPLPGEKSPLRRMQETGHLQLDSRGTSSDAFVPLLVRDQPVGLLMARRDGHAGDFSEADADTIQRVARHLALALALADLRRGTSAAGDRDPETGLFTRQFLDDWLSIAAQAASEAEDHPIALLVVGGSDSSPMAHGDQTNLLLSLAAISEQADIKGPHLAARFEEALLGVLIVDAKADDVAGYANLIVAPREGPEVVVGWALRSPKDLGTLEPGAHMAVEVARRMGSGSAVAG